MAGLYYLPQWDNRLTWIPVMIFIYKVLEVYFWRYEFGEETIVERKGVFNVTRNEIHYYRIKSIQVDEPLQYRIVGISNVNLITSDQFTKEFTFVGVHGGEKLRQEIRTMVAQHRGQKGVKEFDLFNL